MQLPAAIRGPIVSRVAIGVAVVAVVLATRWRWDQLIDAQTPYIDFDTQIYQQIAERPFSLGLQGYNKPLLVPLVYRAAHNDLAAIARFQAELAFVAWAILTATLALALRRGWARALAICVGVAFVLAPPRVGFATSMMSESIGDALTALLVAGGIGLLRLRGRLRIAAAIGVGVVAVAWLLGRDTNAFILATAAGLAILVWRGWRSRWVWACAALVAGAAGVILWSTGLAHAPLPYQAGWYVPFTPRGAYPMLDNVTTRVYPDQRDELPAELRAFVEPTINVERLIHAGPQAQPLQAWLVEHGSSIYTRWLVRHPIDRTIELVKARWITLSPGLGTYMPGGWIRRASVVRTLTLNRTVLLLLVLASPWLLRRPRADAMGGLALCIVVSGTVGVAAAYYGDAAEVARHCYGAGQQVVLGLFLALIAWADRVTWPRSRVARNAGSPGS